MAAGDPVYASDTAVDAWTPYTPVWSAATTAPTLGNGTLTGRTRVTGKTASVQIVLTWGSTTAAGAGGGAWRFSVPFTPQADGLLMAYVDDNSASQRWVGVARFIAASGTGDNMRIVVQAANGGIAGNANPMTWTTGDKLILQGTIEIV